MPHNSENEECRLSGLQAWIKESLKLRVFSVSLAFAVMDCRLAGFVVAMPRTNNLHKLCYTTLKKSVAEMWSFKIDLAPGMNVSEAAGDIATLLQITFLY